MARSRLWLLVRAHQQSMAGAVRFHAGRGLSLFSHPNCQGRGNEGAAALVATDRTVELLSVEPLD